MRFRRVLFHCLILTALSGCARGLVTGDGMGRPAALDGLRDIEISGIITQATADRVLDQLNAASGPEVRLHLDSPGGDVSAALQIHDKLQAGDWTVMTSVADTAQCMSSCTLIFAAGDHRLAGPKSRFRFHAPLYVGRLPLPRPVVDLIEGMTRRGIANTYASVSPEFARHLADPAIRALYSRRGLALSGAQLAQRGDGFFTGLAETGPALLSRPLPVRY
ncbi:ATP-dependent Clp protease proteolytic subunit [Skermanella pratensis]|uniref:ATP-dependent Clp protease proteolytic subunit n=1 Tax=Skermanella pratensis TaxID=2233999 RepID=UPI001300F748|nr:ATP-dependent Clp protease proteolytic subunit [Skermanella pratensis]